VNSGSGRKTHPEEVDAISIAYSAGGIWPCIVGTALLVVGSMIVALFIGNQRRDLSKRVQPRHSLYSASSAWQF
jgi:hypothetical protein